MWKQKKNLSDIDLSEQRIDEKCDLRMRGVAQFTLDVSKSQVKRSVNMFIRSLLYCECLYWGNQMVHFFFLRSLWCHSPEYEASSNIQLYYLLFQIFLYAVKKCVILWVTLNLKYMKSLAQRGHFVKNYFRPCFKRFMPLIPFRRLFQVDLLQLDYSGNALKRTLKNIVDIKCYMFGLNYET